MKREVGGKWGHRKGSLTLLMGQRRLFSRSDRRGGVSHTIRGRRKLRPEGPACAKAQKEARATLRSDSEEPAGVPSGRSVRLEHRGGWRIHFLRGGFRRQKCILA